MFLFRIDRSFEWISFMKFHIFLSLFLLLSASLVAADKAIWIDVRTKGEFDQGHIEKALHIAYEVIGEKISKVTKNKDALIKVYCKVGGRAAIAKSTLQRLGYKNVVNAGGYQQILKERK